MRRPWSLAFPLGGGREFDRIRALARALGGATGRLGDDCALVPGTAFVPDGALVPSGALVSEHTPAPGDAGTVVLSTDLSVEDVHFRTAWLSLEEIGWRAAAGALSDLAAEGAETVGTLVALGVPAGASEADVTTLMRGAGAAVAACGGVVLGGDLSASPVWSVAVTVVGRAVRPVTRAGAQAGDGLWVTGSLGAARAALETWRRGDVPSSSARRAFAHPEPRIAAGQWLARQGAHAMLDLSDGLGGDAAHLASASTVSVAIVLDDLPVAADAVAAARSLEVPPPVFAAEGGEDYELLVALPPAFGAADAERCRRETGVPLTRIGGIFEGAGVRCTLAGAAISLRGFDHFP